MAELHGQRKATGPQPLDEIGQVLEPFGVGPEAGRNCASRTPSRPASRSGRTPSRKTPKSSSSTWALSPVACSNILGCVNFCHSLTVKRKVSGTFCAHAFAAYMFGG